VGGSRTGSGLVLLLGEVLACRHAIFSLRIGAVYDRVSTRSGTVQTGLLSRVVAEPADAEVEISGYCAG
jgi:hypothetical protein